VRARTPRLAWGQGNVGGLYVLYGAPGRASAAPEAVLEEIGVAYEYAHVDAAARRGDAYRRVNRLGQVPTLVDGERAITEAAAICIYLCDRHPQAGLAPAIDSPLRGLFYQWMFFLSNTLQPAYMLWFYPERVCSDASGAALVRQGAAARIGELWREIELGLDPGPHLVGEQLTACDIYLHMLSTWHRESIVPLDRFPRVRRALELTAARPGVRRMMARNDGH
jgi:glutathione S-transferase